MNLHEYQAKQLLKEYQIPVPEGIVCSTVDQAESAFNQLRIPCCIIKCQVHAGGRGKAGGVNVIHSAQQARKFAAQWLTKNLVTHQTTTKGQPVNKLLIEKATSIAGELYLGAILDRASQSITMMASKAGGVNIEEVAHQTPKQLFSIALDPLTGPQPFQARQLAYQLGLNPTQVEQFTHIFMKLSQLFIDKDLEMLEINPLAITAQNELLCLDAKISVDNNALFRQPKLKALYDHSQDDPMEVCAANNKLSYVALDGNIGCLVNGAGLAMATMDMVKLYGGNPANFLDVGGGTTKERVTQAFNIILTNPKVQVIFVNIFGGIVRCDLIAEGIIHAVTEIGTTLPIVVRLEGNRANIGAERLAKSHLNIISNNDLAKATQHVVKLVGN